MAQMMITSALHAIGFKTSEMFCLLPVRCQFAAFGQMRRSNLTTLTCGIRFMLIHACMLGLGESEVAREAIHEL